MYERDCYDCLEKRTPHKHAALIKAWADGAKIQVLHTGIWHDILMPLWDAKEYRINPVPVPHKHAALIKEWAGGANIELKGSDGTWITCNPSWNKETAYRIKPIPKPDIVRYSCLSPDGAEFTRGKIYAKHNICHVYDGETGKLKSVSMIGE